MNSSSLLRFAPTGDARKALRSLLAFAAGDAFGVAYEYLPEPIPVDMSRIGTRDDWPLGGVSDDTHLSLLTVFAAIDDDPVASGARFLEDLRAALPRLRGLGPTTKAALGLDPDPGEDYAVVGTTVIGDTNGGMMRTSLLGLGFTAAQDDDRRRMVAGLARVTHTAQAAITCAVLGSALYARAFDTPAVPVGLVLEREAAALELEDTAVSDWLDDVDAWNPPATGISLDPVETLAAVVWVVQRATSLLDAYRIACELGGDTDTVAALAGGIVELRRSEGDDLDVPWIDDVLWSEIPEVVAAAERLAHLRGPR